MRRLMLFAAVCLAAAPAFAAPRVSMPVDREPPAPVYEVTPPERPGYLWNPGCWKWDGKRMVWDSGSWIAKRPGYSWIPDGWEKRADKWYFAPGYWQADNAAEAVLSGEALHELPDAPSPTTESAPAVKLKYVPKAVRKHSRKQPDYSDKRVWTRYINH